MIYLTSIKRSFSQFTEKRTLQLLLKTVLLTFCLLMLINFCMYYILDWFGLYDYLINKLSAPLWVSKILTLMMLHILSMLLFPALLIGVSGIFLEEIADYVEARYYPHLPKSDMIPIPQQIKSIVTLIGLILLVNILMIPIYFFPVINIFVFYFMNGYLISTEYFELISLRRLSFPDYNKLWKKKFFGIYMGGVICSIGMSIPILNLFVPYLSTAFMVHLFDSYTAYDHKTKTVKIIS